ncbi:hypothetical protein [Nonomuraea sp. 10N515B]|uniref:hypothetical protein n=1 Tax=Nonomuraea sp. 10N515B TaxID=3457422 RepID=UPI003FCE10BD
MNPYVLCALAVVAAAAAAAVGHALHPKRRALRAQRRRWIALSVHRFSIAGQMARDPSLWEQWWNEHELDDVLRGGA